MDGWDRPILHGLPQRLALAVVENASSARCLAVQETIRTLGVEAENPIAHDLQPGAANPRRIGARAACINLRKRQKTPGLIGITRLPRKPAQSSGIKIGAKRNRTGHGKPWKKLFAILNQTEPIRGITLAVESSAHPAGLPSGGSQPANGRKLSGQIVRCLNRTCATDRQEIELLTDDVSCDKSRIRGKPLAANALFGCFLPRLGPLVATPAASLMSCWLIRRRFVSCLPALRANALPTRPAIFQEHG